MAIELYTATGSRRQLDLSKCILRHEVDTPYVSSNFYQLTDPEGSKVYANLGLTIEKDEEGLKSWKSSLDILKGSAFVFVAEEGWSKASINLKFLDDLGQKNEDTFNGTPVGLSYVLPHGGTKVVNSLVNSHLRTEQWPNGEIEHNSSATVMIALCVENMFDLNQLQVSSASGENFLRPLGNRIVHAFYNAGEYKTRESYKLLLAELAAGSSSPVFLTVMTAEEYSPSL